MKKSIVVMLLFVLFSLSLLSCKAEVDNNTTTAVNNETISKEIPELDDLSVLNVPGLKWGMTPEEVKTALGVTDEQIEEGAFGSRWRLMVKNITRFGEDVALGEFFFDSFSDANPFALSSVSLYYPEETDMNAVMDALTDTYGAPMDSLGFTRYRIRNGAIEEYTDSPTLENYTGASHMINYWESAAKQIDVLPADVQEKMATTGMVDVSGVGSGLNTDDPAAREIVREYLEQESAVSLYCTDSHESGKYGAPYTRNCVNFSATNYIAMIQYHRK